jgi:hypothetical protein
MPLASSQVGIFLSTTAQTPHVDRRALVRRVAQLLLVAGLLVLAALNISTKAWTEMEDGVYWAGNGVNVIAREVAPESPAALAGIEPGDVLLKIDQRDIEGRNDVVDALHRSRAGGVLHYIVVRTGSQAPPQMITLRVAGIPGGPRWLYLTLAGVGIFTLLVGTGVRLRRQENQATLHFFWLSVAFFGVLAFSFSGRLDRTAGRRATPGARCSRCCICRRCCSVAPGSPRCSATSRAKCSRT